MFTWYLENQASALGLGPSWACDADTQKKHFKARIGFDSGWMLLNSCRETQSLDLFGRILQIFRAGVGAWRQIGQSKTAVFQHDSSWATPKNIAMAGLGMFASTAGRPL